MNECKIKLRPLEPEDLELLYLIENDQELWNVGATNVPYSRYVLRDYIANTTSDIYTDKQLRLMIEKDDGVVVGIVDLVDFDPRNQRAEIGIVVIDSYRRFGYGSAALSLLIDYCHTILHIHQLYAYVDATNDACLALLSKHGFHRSAVLHDWLHTGSGFVDAMLMTRI